jgi:UDP-MurNAc hydroxylase
MKLDFVNHSSFVIESGGVRLICDPWIEGRAFNDGWELLVPSVFSYQDFASITHIWFSHEHPDHFAPSNLRAIPDEFRQRITVLYQRSADGKVAKCCRKAGFGTVIELDPDTPLELEPGFEVLCNPWTSGDSYLHVRTPGTTLLNLNDCAILTEEEAADVAGRVGAVDVLATQFSLSAWEGNPEEVERRRAGARRMLDRTLLHARALQPSYVIPFGSFVWFCHEENAYINAEMNRIGGVYRELTEDTEATPVVLYPGDTWVVGDEHSSDVAIRRWEEALDAVPKRDRVKSRRVCFQDLEDAAEAFCRKLSRQVGPGRIRLSLAMGHYRRRRREEGSGLAARARRLLGLLQLHLEPAHIWISDHERAVDFDQVHGLHHSHRSREECDVAVGSDSLRYGFEFLWGGESLLVNGRFSEIRPGGRDRLFEYYFQAHSHNIGRVCGWSDLFAGLLRRVRNSG